MHTKQKFGCLFGTIRGLIVQPIWYYLLFKILKAVDASDLMWILFWFYIPVGIVITLAEVIIYSIFDDGPK